MAAEYILANQSELNQAAKRMLQESGRQTDPQGLYCLQLVRWAVQREGVSKINRHLLLFLELLEGWQPESVVSFLEKNRRGEFLSIINGGNWKADDFPLRIIEYVDICMTEKVEGYRPRRPSRPITAEQKLAA